MPGLLQTARALCTMDTCVHCKYLLDNKRLLTIEVSTQYIDTRATGWSVDLLTLYTSTIYSTNYMVGTVL